MQNRDLSLDGANRYIRSFNSKPGDENDFNFTKSAHYLFNPEIIKRTTAEKIFHFLYSLNLLLRNKSIKSENRIEIQKYNGHIPKAIEPPRNVKQILLDFLEDMRLKISNDDKEVWLIKLSAMIIFCHIFPDGNGRLVRYIYHTVNNSGEFSNDNIFSRPLRFGNFFQDLNKMAIIRVLEKYRIIDSRLGLREKMDKSENFFGNYILNSDYASRSLFEALLPDKKEIVSPHDINRNIKLLALICYYIQTDQEDKITNNCVFTEEIVNSSIYLNWYDHIATEHIRAVLDEIDEQADGNFNSFFNRFTKSFE